MDIELDSNERRLLPLWVCTICNLSGKPMIMDCECSETICINCVQKISTCPFCRSPVKVPKFNKALVEYTNNSPVVYDAITHDTEPIKNPNKSREVAPEIVINFIESESDPLSAYQERNNQLRHTRNEKLRKIDRVLFILTTIFNTILGLMFGVDSLIPLAENRILANIWILLIVFFMLFNLVLPSFRAYHQNESESQRIALFIVVMLESWFRYGCNVVLLWTSVVQLIIFILSIIDNDPAMGFLIGSIFCLFAYFLSHIAFIKTYIRGGFLPAEYFEN